MSTSTDGLLGQVLDGRYRVEHKLGEGGMGFVFAGTHVTLDHKIAIKTLHPRLAFHGRYRERFLREAKSASKVRHPNVVQIMDFGDTPDGSVYFVMEYLEGRDLRELLREDGPLPWPRVREILIQAVGALDAAHRKGIIHRDIKPANCFLARTDTGAAVVKLLDFGIAKLRAEADESGISKLTGTDEVFGTATYMAPEQARGESLDARSDMYALGVVAYEMLTGKAPFTGTNPIHVITKHLNDAPMPPRMLEPSIPPAVEALVLKAIEKDKDDRFVSMAELEDALRSIPENEGLGSRRTLSWGEVPPSTTEPVEGSASAATLDEPTPVLGARAAVGSKARPPRVVPRLGGPKTTVLESEPASAGHVTTSTPILPPLEGSATVVEVKDPPDRSITASRPTELPVDEIVTVVDINAPPDRSIAASAPTLPPMAGNKTVVDTEGSPGDGSEPKASESLDEIVTIVDTKGPKGPTARVSTEPAPPARAGIGKTLIARNNPAGSEESRPPERPRFDPPPSARARARRVMLRIDPPGIPAPTLDDVGEGPELVSKGSAVTLPPDAVVQARPRVITDVSPAPGPSTAAPSPAVVIPASSEGSAPIIIPPGSEASAPAVVIPPTSEASAPAVVPMTSESSASPSEHRAPPERRRTSPSPSPVSVGVRPRVASSDVTARQHETPPFSERSRRRLFPMLVVTFAFVASAAATWMLVSRGPAEARATNALVPSALERPSPPPDDDVQIPSSAESDAVEPDEDAIAAPPSVARDGNLGPSTTSPERAVATDTEDGVEPDTDGDGVETDTDADDGDGVETDTATDDIDPTELAPSTLPSDEDPTDDDPKPLSKSSRPNHLTQACDIRRIGAENAFVEARWKTLLRLTGLASCWPRDGQARRLMLRARGYLEVGNYERCVALSRHVRDSATKEIVQTCREKLDER